MVTTTEGAEPKPYSLISSLLMLTVLHAIKHSSQVGIVLNHIGHHRQAERKENIVGDNTGLNPVEHDFVENVHCVSFVVWCPLRHACIISSIRKASIHIHHQTKRFS